MTVIDEERTTSGAKDKASPSPISTDVRNFLEYTTAHGCGRLAAARGMFWTSFWIILCIGAHAAFYYHSYLLVNNYLERATRTKESVLHVKNLEFPVLTICNRNILRKSQITADMARRIEEFLNTTANTTEQSKTNMKSNYQSLLVHPNQVHSTRAKLNYFRSLMSEIKEKDLKKMGHQLEDMLLDCSFNGQDCRDIKDTTTWRPIWIEDAGNCYMFNHALNDNGNTIEARKAHIQGQEHGLSLILNVEQHEYIDGITAVAGLSVIVGSHGQMPFPVFEGISVGPGLSTSMQIQMVTSSTLSFYFLFITR
ncbi:hypothetical protein QZH41_012012 [Actinostola sp. cb2023]|nr:hypothetical protein QZH41_012012 [Actinostola sp. cb2023]